ncbi:Dbl homology domain-containing protein [Lentinula aciculospora]|uniref:Dbl homology domain-containing protein n=1 Tax=Lentinula aciculospora TaxID=153920 RepID=A0A9W9AWF5_9AGAR|nr:Dbl homology domain-containing protein [Lentinula aciculospora]
MEVQRQEMIWEMRTAETAFVERLSSVVSLFIIPLRIQTTKTWIAGVPLEIAKVLDWLEDIVNLHTQIRDTLQSFQTQEIPFADISEHQDHDRVGVAYTLRSFVPRFEIYQPYLVKLSGVLEILERLVGDNGSDFGEFVRLQEKTPECRASFGNMLLEPADRVATYPGLFQKFLDVTPKDHKEYLPTLMLVHATTLVVKTLQTVKAREEEYELIKSISERIDGLPTATNLARRDRRLLCHGQLLSLDLHQHLRNSNSRWTPNAKAINTPNRTNRLVDAINDWDTRRSRSGSVKSNNSASTGVSFRSVETSSPPPPPQVMVLVFSDLVVLATTRFSLRESSNQIPQEQQGLERWTVCEDIGVTRVLEVHEIDSNVTDAAGLSHTSKLIQSLNPCT